MSEVTTRKEALRSLGFAREFMGSGAVELRDE